MSPAYKAPKADAPKIPPPHDGAPPMRMRSTSAVCGPRPNNLSLRIATPPIPSIPTSGSDPRAAWNMQWKSAISNKNATAARASISR